MRATVNQYCAALEQGNFGQAVRLIDPEDRLAFWHAMRDIQEALHKVGELGAGVHSVPFCPPGRRVADQDPAEFLEGFLQITMGDVSELRYSVDTVDEVAPGRGLAVYSVEGISNTLDLVHRHGQWYIKLREGANSMAEGLKRRAEDFLNRAGRDKPALVEGDLQPVELHGYVDPAGHVVIEPRFAAAEPFHEGRAAVQCLTCWGYISPTGQLVIPAQYRAAGPFSEGVAWVMPHNDSWTYSLIDRDGKEILPPRYAEVHDFSEGLAAVREETLWGYIDRTGRYVLPPKYIYAYSFYSGRAEVNDEDEGPVCIDREGRIVPSPYENEP